MERYTLKNGIKTIIKRNNNTPRCAIVMHAKINKDPAKTGLYYIMTQLFFQGTKTKTAQELADLMDENAIDISADKKSDYIIFKIQCLNEDINTAMEIFQDIIENSTFDEYKKEALKIKGEFKADLDSPKLQAQENYYRTIFKNHPYGIGRQEIIDNIDLITKEDIIKAGEEIKNNAAKNITVVGDFEKADIINLLEKHFANLKSEDSADERTKVAEIKEQQISVIEKEDANQAQIFKGWQFPNIYSEDYAAIILLNTILGSSGFIVTFVS